MQGEAKMPTIKILRNGQLTLPAKLRKALDLKEGDLLNAELEKDKIILKPVTVIEREKIKKRFFQLVEENWKKNKDLELKEVEKIVKEEVEKARKRAK